MLSRLPFPANRANSLRNLAFFSSLQDHGALRIARSRSAEEASPQFILPTTTGILEATSQKELDLVILLTDSLDRGFSEAKARWAKSGSPVVHDLTELAKDPKNSPSLRDFKIGRANHRMCYGNMQADSAFKSSRLLVSGLADEQKDAENPPQIGAYELKSSLHSALEFAKESLPVNENDNEARGKIGVLLADDGAAGKEEIVHLMRTAMLSNYSFDRYTDKKSGNRRLHSVLLDIGEERLSLLSSKDAEIAANYTLGTSLARELALERGDIANPQFMEDVARAISSTHDLNVRSIAGEDLVRQGFNMIHSVGKAAQWAPRLVVLEHWGKSGKRSDCSKPIVLVGKGITFDSGGLNLKPTGYIENMHADKSGACAVLGAMKSLALMDVKEDVIAILALAENSIGSQAFKPNSIISTDKGSVEAGNTDAEGRLALADAFTLAQRDFSNISCIVDIATLTGACVVALGEYLAGVFANEPGIRHLVPQILSSGDRTYERCWHLPITREHREELKGDYSDMKSIGKGRYGGASTAAAFLERFVNQGTPWVHLDIAGPAMYSSKQDWFLKDGTGFGAQLLTDFVYSRSNGN